MRSHVKGQASGCSQGLAHSTPPSGPRASASLRLSEAQSCRASSAGALLLRHSARRPPTPPGYGAVRAAHRTNSPAPSSSQLASARRVDDTRAASAPRITSSGTSRRLLPSSGSCTRATSSPSRRTSMERGHAWRVGSPRLAIRSSMLSPSSSAGHWRSTVTLPRLGCFGDSAESTARARTWATGRKGSKPRKPHAQSPPTGCQLQALQGMPGSSAPPGRWRRRGPLSRAGVAEASPGESLPGASRPRAGVAGQRLSAIASSGALPPSAAALARQRCCHARIWATISERVGGLLGPWQTTSSSARPKRQSR
mmetsp:Transcript_80846/g.251014  ORF Transcript_80846/g.251014 Transcript_80846/m.251014 type:complete len:311 (+) Transcript_80846:332-1264(+)